MKPVLRFTPLLLTAVLASASFGAARPTFAPSPLSTFDGTRWSGLVLGQTTFKVLRPLFETGDGEFDRSTELSLPKTAGLRVDCLWNKNGQDEVLSAITLHYTGTTPSSNQLQQAFDPDGTQGEALYLRGRFEDWRVVRFPQKGVTAFQVRDAADGEYITPLLVLSAPDSLERLSQSLVGEETPVEERVDPMAGAPKIGEFGEITVDFNGRETEVIPTWVRSDVRDDLRDASAGGTLRWNRGTNGYYRMNVSASRNKKKDAGSFTISTDISATGPYGVVHVTGSGTERWDATDDNYAPTPSSAFDRAVREARRDAEGKFEKAMLASGPPTLESVREGEWHDLVALLRAPQAPIVTVDGKPATGGPVIGF